MYILFVYLAVNDNLLLLLFLVYNTVSSLVSLLNANKDIHKDCDKVAASAMFLICLNFCVCSNFFEALHVSCFAITQTIHSCHKYNFDRIQFILNMVVIRLMYGCSHCDYMIYLCGRMHLSCVHCIPMLSLCLQVVAMIILIIPGQFILCRKW